MRKPPLRRQSTGRFRLLPGSESGTALALDMVENLLEALESLEDDAPRSEYVRVLIPGMEQLFSQVLSSRWSGGALHTGLKW